MRPDPRVTARKHPRYPWAVVWYEGAVRRTAFFKGRKEADGFRSRKVMEIRQMPAGEDPVRPEELRAVLRARDLGVPLWDAVEAFATSARARAASVTVAHLVARRREAMAREDLSARYELEMEQFLRSVESQWGGRMVCDLTVQDVEDFVFAGAVGARVNRKRKVLLGGLFRFAEAAGLMSGNPAARVRTPTLQGTAIALLSPEESRRYLLAVATVAPAALAAEAIRMFAGLRKAEIDRLQWSQVWRARGLLEVGAAQAKTKMRRLVDIEPALDGILGATERVSGPVAPIGYRDLIERAQAAGGWRDERGRSTWPANCLRHGFVSYHLALYNDAARTELQAGHDRAVMFRNYRELVTREAAEEFWSVSLCG